MRSSAGNWGPPSAASGEAAAVEQRHAAYYRALAAAAGPVLEGGGDQATWLRRLGADLDTLRQALRWLVDHHCTEPALRLAAGTWRYFYQVGQSAEGREWLTAALDLPDGVEHRAAYAAALLAAGHLAGNERDWEEAARSGAASLALHRALGDDPGAAFSLQVLGKVAQARGDLARARALQEESLVLRRMAGDRVGEAHSLTRLGEFAELAGDLESARAAYSHQGEHDQILYALEGVAITAAGQGHAERCVRLCGAVDAAGGDRGGDPPEWRRLVAESLSRARTALGERAAATAYAEGQAMSRVDAIAHALEPALPPPVAPMAPVAAASSAAAPEGGAVLSARERQVAALVARGLTNKQIAAALIITGSSVNRHLEHILAKLHLRSRIQVATWATTHGVVDLTVPAGLADPPAAPDAPAGPETPRV